MDNKIIDSVFTHFSILHTDTRWSFSLSKYYQIFLDVEHHGLRAATRLNGVMTHLCKRCAHTKKNKMIRIEMIKDCNSPTRFRCQICAGTEGIIRYLTVKHLKKKESIVRKTFANFDSKMSTFLLHLMLIQKILRSNDYMHQLFWESFEYNMNLAIKDRLCLREHYFVGHYDSTRVSKRRWCSLTEKHVKSLISKNI